MAGYGFIDRQIIAEIEDGLRHSADECAAEAVRVRTATSERFADDVRAEVADEAARRYRQLADAVERGIFGFLDFEDVDPSVLRRPLTARDVLAAKTPGEQLLAMTNAHFALPGEAA